MTNFNKWLAKSPIASALKIAAAAALVWALENMADFQLEPIVQVALTAALPVIINWLNPEDGRYGYAAGGDE